VSCLVVLLISPFDDVRLVVPVFPRAVGVDVGVDAGATREGHDDQAEKFILGLEFKRRRGTKLGRIGSGLHVKGSQFPRRVLVALRFVLGVVLFQLVKGLVEKKEVCDLVPYSLRADEGHGHERNVPGMKRTFRETTRTSLTMPEDLTELE
jgi:hypothetical protein